MTDQSVNVYIRAIDQFSGTAAKVTGSIKTMEGAASKFSGSMVHAKGQISGLVGKLGFLGLAGGVLSFTGALEQSITKAQSWGLQIEKLQGITHDSAEQLSGLLAVTEKYGLSNERLSQIAGFTEKTLGNLAASGAGVTDFTKNFGFALTDTKGKILDFNTLLLKFADYWDSNAAASTKAAAAAHLFGRGYADLVPVLNLGAKGIKDAEAEAAALGLTLTQDNVAALAKAREATRQWGDALSGLELQIGLGLLPSLTDLAKTAETFVAHNRDGIVNGFKSAAGFAEQLGGAIHDVVLPALGAVGGWWTGLPKELRDLLVGGFAIQKGSHWLLGSGPLDWIKGGIGIGGKKAGIGAMAGIGVQHVWVDNMGFGGPGGGPGAGFGAAGLGIDAATGLGASAGIAGLSTILSIAAPLGLLAAYAAAQPYKAGTTPGDHFLRDQTKGQAWGAGKRADDTSIIPGISAADDARETKAIASYNRITIPGLTPALSDIAKAIESFGYTTGQWQAIYARAAKAGGSSQINTLARTHKALDAIALSASETSKFLTGTAGPFFRDGKNLSREIAADTAAQKWFNDHGDTKTASVLGRDIALLKGAVEKQKPPVVNAYLNLSLTELNNRRAVRVRIGPTSGSYGSREGKIET